METKQKVLLIGLQAADWKVMFPLLEAGKLPHLAGLIDEGVIGKMTGVRPGEAPAAWTSVATGKYPHRHGILRNWEPLAAGNGVRPVTCLGRRSKALWNILGQHGYSCQVIGWPASHPAEPLRNGVMVSNHFPVWAPGSSPQDDWLLPPGGVHPSRMKGALADLRVHPGELNGVHLVPFVPKLATMEFADDPRLQALAAVLAQAASLHAASAHCMEQETWNFHAVLFSGIHRISQLFMNYHPPRPEFVSEADFALYHRVVEGAYVFHDQLLGRLVEQAGKNATVMVVSDQGFHSGQFRHNAPPNEPGNPPEHREVGMFVARGPGLRRDQLIFGSSLVDLAPTILHHCGFPVGGDMDGKVLAELFEEPGEIGRIESWDEEAESDGQHSPGKRYDPLAICFGDDEDVATRSEGRRLAITSVFELRYSRAESLISAREEAEAILELEKAWKDDPGESRYANKIMHCYLALKRPDLARQSFERMLQEKKRFAAQSLAEWEALDARDPATLQEWEKSLKLKLWKRSRSNLSGMAFLQAWLLHGEGRHEDALRVAAAADENKVYNRIGLIKLQGDCHSKLKRWNEAQAAYDRVLELDPGDPDAYLGLARLHYEREHFEDSASYAQSAVSLRYFNPAAHYLYAGAIYRCGKPHAAADALKVAVKQSPMLLGAYQRLILLYNGPLKKPRVAGHWAERLDRAKKQKKAFDERRRKEVQDLPLYESAQAQRT